MAGTYTQIYIQLIFAVKNRQALVKEAYRERLQMYITGTLQNMGHKMLAIYCMPDHCHIFVGLSPGISISDTVRDVKVASTKWINEEKLTPYKFAWQQGFGGFSYSKSLIDRVCKYILNQPEHHRKKSFKEEYLDILQKLDIEYKPEYLFEWLDEE